MFVAIRFFVQALCFMFGFSSLDTGQLERFKAAVYEHAVIMPENRTVVVNRSQALELMYANLELYAEQVFMAKKQGAHIIVFPEDGIYGFGYTWESIRPYLEYIPDPLEIDWTPCDNPTRYRNTEVQYMLSCLAKENDIYLVANMGDLQPCNDMVSSSCRPMTEGEAYFHYNTDVAFDPQGQLISRYHKQNLFFEEQFSTPAMVELSTFDTPFGRWGMFTCFDILFKEPAVTLIETKNVTNVAFPTAWMDALPLLASVEFHSAFARGMGVNFLAANLHLPQWSFQGSGVYTPDGQAVFTHNRTAGSQSKLVVAEIDVISASGPKVYSSNSCSHSTDGSGVMHSSFSSRFDPSLMTTEADVQNGSVVFQAELFHDRFSFVALRRPVDRLDVCHGSVCCHLNYSFSHNATRRPELFAFGAFDGLHTFNGRYYLQICALVRCAGESGEGCGQPTNSSTTTFQFMSMTGAFQTDHVYPEVLLVDSHNRLRLAEAASWSYTEHNHLLSRTGFRYPVLAVSLFGRDYSRDRGSVGSSVNQDVPVVWFS